MPVHRLRFLVSCALCSGVLAWGSTAHAAAQVNKFSLVFSANPTTVDPKDFNDKVIDNLNKTQLEPRGLEGVKPIRFAWLYDAQMRYFVRPNFAVEAGVSQLRTFSRREYLPAINAAVEFRAELLSAPVHLGGAYYLPPYNQGDFQARMYLGGGFASLVYNRARFTATFANTDSARSGINSKLVARRDSPGYYVDSGVHMFFGGRYSVLVGVLYRSSMVRNAEAELELRTANGGITRYQLGPYFDIDTSGIGGKMALAIGF